MMTHAHLTRPGPPGHRLLGFLPAFRENPLRYLEETCAYGDVVFLPYGRALDVLLRTRDTGAYLLRHPADIKHVLVTNQGNYPKSRFPTAERRLFGKGLLHREGANHQHRRRIILPTLASGHHAEFASIVTDQTRQRLTRWMAEPLLELSRAMTEVTLAVIWEILFHEPLREHAAELYDGITTAQEKLSSQYNSLLAMLLPLWVPTWTNWKFAYHVRRLDAIVYGLIRQRRSAATQTDGVVSVLMQAKDELGQPLSDREVRDELMTLLLAGHETTANALTWAWIVLAEHPAVVQTLREELQRVLDGRVPAYEDLPKLIYTRMVWDEVLRLYPPAWMLHTRHARRSDTLPSGATLPAGTEVLLSPYLTQRDPRWYARPNEFDPQHCAGEEKEQRPPFAYFPFGGGGRHCAGEGLANVEGPLILATMAQRADVSFLSGQTIEPQALFTLRPKTPLWMHLAPVKRLAAQSL